MIQNTKLISTLGPTSLKIDVINKLKKNVDIFRLNMSHLTIENLEKNLKFLKKNKIKNICIDTEGAQIRTANVKKTFLKKNLTYVLSNQNLNVKNLIKLTPIFDFKNIIKNTLVKIGFDGLELKVIKNYKKYIKCCVVNEGILDSNKGVHFNEIYSNPLTEKDLVAIKLAKKYGVSILPYLLQILAKMLKN